MTTIEEMWIPSPNFSDANPQKLKGAFHTTEGADTIQSLGGWFGQTAAQCSSHHGADNYTTVFGAYVYEDATAWTQGGMNGVCESIELCAYASWPRSTWLGAKYLLTQNAARWMRYMSDKYQIPMVWLNSSQSQDSWTKGFTQHSFFGSKGSGHHDCGDGFPTDVILELAKASSSVSVEGVFMSSSVFDSQGGLHLAGVWEDGKVNYKPPGGAWVATDPNSNAKGGADISYSPVDDKLVISFTNQGGKFCTYEKPVNGGSWSWADRGGNFR